MEAEARISQYVLADRRDFQQWGLHLHNFKKSQKIMSEGDKDLQASSYFPLYPYIIFSFPSLAASITSPIFQSPPLLHIR